MIWLFSIAPLVDGITGYRPPYVLEDLKSKTASPSETIRQRVAQAISDDVHQRCLAANDYTGCIRSNSGEPSSQLRQSNANEQSADAEKCWSSGVCVAKSGKDQLGLSKVVGWNYKYYPSNNTVKYWKVPPKRVPHKGQPDRYIALSHIEHYYQQPIAAKPGYYREITPARTECKPNYSSGTWINGIYKKNVVGQTCTTSSPTKIWVAGTPGVPGGPQRRSWVTVIDCEDMTSASYIDGKLRGNWKKDRRNVQEICKPDRSKLEPSNMKL